MNVLNRVVVVLLVIVALFLCVALFVAPVPILNGLGAQMQAWGQALAAQPGWLRLLVGLLFALAWLVICVLLLILELRRPPVRMVRVEKVGGGEVEVSLRTVSERVTFDVDQLPGILRVRPQVSARRGGVVVEVEVDTASEVEVPAQAERIIEVVRQGVEERIGVKLAQPPKVRMRAAPAPVTAALRPPRDRAIE